jgi:RimJ/RimL family protein N-acetyltransferase
MKFHIETERLILRELQVGDLQAWYEMDSNAEVHKYLGNQPVQSMLHIENAFQSIQQQYLKNGIGRWATIEKSSGNFIGWSGLKFITELENNHINFHDVGYRLMPKYWGKGYATESCKAALEYAFNKMQLNEVIGICHEDNKASRNALEKSGLKFIEKFVEQSSCRAALTCDWLKITKSEWIQIANGVQNPSL